MGDELRREEPQAARVLVGDARRVLADLEVEDPRGVVVVTDPVWPNVPAGMFDVEDPAKLFRDVARHFPRVARRAVVHLGCGSDPRFLAGVPRRMPFVRVCWLRYACPSYLGTVLGSGDVAYVYGSNEGPEGKVVLPGECTSNDPHGREVTEHPCPRKIEHLVWLIRFFTKSTDLVLDPFCGSGTTGVAARRLGRRFLGVELSPAFAAIARQRIAAEENGSTYAAVRAGQTALFGHVETRDARTIAARKRLRGNAAKRRAARVA